MSALSRASLIVNVLNMPFNKILLEFFRLPIGSKFKKLWIANAKNKGELCKEEADKHKERLGTI